MTHTLKIEYYYEMNQEVIVDVGFSSLGLSATIDRLDERMEFSRAKPLVFACVNPHSVELTRRDPEFAAAIADADLITADGSGIVLASRMLGGLIRERVCGPDIFVQLCAKLNAERPGTRMFFLGTNDATLQALREKLAVDFPQLIVAGTLAPPYRQVFSNEENQAMIDAVNASESDILWVGLGAPKQEKWVHQVKNRLKVKLIGPVGGVFDFYTGRVKLPPMWMQKMGLIWLYRLCQEPRRLWRRNLDSPVFLVRVIWQRIFKGKNSS